MTTHPSPLIQALLSQSDDSDLKETHLSWVVMLGPYAYKIKKPVNFGFQDFSSLAQREYYCRRELSRNQRYAQSLYLGVVGLYGTPGNPSFEADGEEPFEYAVKMYRFDHQDIFSQQLEDGALTEGHIQALAKQIADFHAITPVVSAETLYGSATLVHAPVTENFDIIRQSEHDEKTLSRLNAIQAHADQDKQALSALMQNRKTRGFVRSCHGDMHLGNAVIWQGQPTLFDCIEFNDHFSEIDVISDIAFLVMDLMAFNRPDLAYVCLNTYLEHTGDYEGLTLLPYYLCYRAMVRAKIAHLQHLQYPHDLTFPERFEQYLQLAEQYQKPQQGHLTITCGVSGSGKSTAAYQYLKTHQAIRLRSDVERKRLNGLTLHRPSAQETHAELYSEKNNLMVFQHLSGLTDLLLSQGWHVIVDATFLSEKMRTLFYKISEKHQLPFHILYCKRHLNDIEKDLKQRATLTHEPSDANFSITLKQLSAFDPLNDLEKNHLIQPT